jgi:fluoroquinolone transport system permease protein
MSLSNTFRTLGQQDMRLIGRDSFLVGMVFYVVGAALLVWWGLPQVADWVATRPEWGVSVPDYYPLFVGYMAIYLAAVLVGMIFGFVVIDERDQRTFPALLVTPLPPSRYLAYRIFMGWLLGTVVAFAELLLLNWVMLPWWQLLLMAAGGGLVAPAIMLFMAAMSENKVQGFAAIKIIGGAGLLFFGAWFVPEPLEFLFGLYPPYWSVKTYWAAAAGDSLWWLYWTISVVILSVSIWGLSRWFSRVAYTA